MFSSPLNKGCHAVFVNVRKRIPMRKTSGAVVFRARGQQQQKTAEAVRISIAWQKIPWSCTMA
jgi:hypothetical protein